MVRVKKKHFKKKYRPVGLLINVNAMIYFKYKLDLKFRINKYYSSITVNFHTGLL